MSDTAVQIENLGKRYRIGIAAGDYKTFREAFTGAVRTPIENLKRLRSLTRFDDTSENGDANDLIWALRDVSFDVKQGEIVGIIGANGAGKSTLLKILSRIVEPTTGFAKIRGRISSLLEVGTGFHPELTGRENIYLNGTVLGMRKKEIDRKFDDIVDFSGVEKFINTPVKRYSSGMQVRLAFSVAAHLEPEILIVDEVLAVGDAEFQKKCLGRMGQVAKEGRTVIFVSHNMAAVQGLCTRVVWLKDGMVACDGEPAQIVVDYLDSNNDGFQQLSHHKYRSVRGSGLRIEKVVCRNKRGDVSTNYEFGEDLEVEVHYFAERKIDSPYFQLTIASQHGPLCAASMLLDGETPVRLEGAGVLKCVFKTLGLLPQTYTLRMGVRGEDGSSALFDPTNIASFCIVSSPKDMGLGGPVVDVFARTAPPMVVPYEWHMPDGRVEKIDFLSKRKGGERIELE